jgi:ABC-type molybdate transport system substrate-binding protein
LEAAEYAEVIDLSESERQAVRQPLLALSMADKQIYGKRFADLLISPRGREIMKKHGF